MRTAGGLIPEEGISQQTDGQRDGEQDQDDEHNGPFSVKYAMISSRWTTDESGGGLSPRST